MINTERSALFLSRVSVSKLFKSLNMTLLKHIKIVPHKKNGNLEDFKSYLGSPFIKDKIGQSQILS